jgi:Protein of unknown function (DUF1236)
MNKSALLGSTAIGLLLCIAPANAQMQQKSAEEKAAPSQQHEPGTSHKEQQGQSKQKAEPNSKGAQGETKEQPGKGTAQTKPSDNKGTAQKAAEPQDKASKGTAEKAPEPKDKSTKGTAERAPAPQDKATKGAASEPNRSGNTGRVQLTEEKRTNLSQTILKDRHVNRLTDVNVSINIGTRLPRSVHLVALPVAVIEIVPEYRSYRYFVKDDQICIVDPNSYEIVEVIPASGQVATRNGPATLVLTDEERAIVLREVDRGGGSTLGLGALTEGSDVPRDVKVRAFPEAVIQKVPKLKGYSFLTAENRVAIVDRQGGKVRLVIDQHR